MSELTEKETIVIKHYDPSQSPEENAQRISRKTGIKLHTCRCYITPFLRGLSSYDYNYGEENRILHPTEPSKVIEMYDNQNKNEQSLNELKREEIEIGIQEIIEELPLEQKEIVTAHFYEDKSHEEIAERMGISRQAVSSRMKRILKKLHSSAIREGLDNYFP